MIIGLGYQQRVGKDWAGRLLEEHYGFHRVKFSDYLYQIAGRLVSWPAPLDNDKAREKFKVSAIPGLTQGGQTGRDLLQWLGTDVIRAVCPHLWVSALMYEIDARPLANYVITDVRFPNELQAIRKRGGRVYCIRRPSLEKKQKKSTHITENALTPDNFDGTIINNDNADYLRRIENVVGL